MKSSAATAAVVTERIEPHMRSLPAARKACAGVPSTKNPQLLVRCRGQEPIEFGASTAAVGVRSPQRRGQQRLRIARPHPVIAGAVGGQGAGELLEVIGITNL